MTDIPYSFVPGTKAKAQEVNANFIALANSIDENQTSTETRLTDAEDDIAALQAKKYVDFNTFSNAVLEAPNGIIRFTSNSLTVKSGLRVLIPDGKYNDGTLINADYTLDSDVSVDLSNYTNGSWILFLKSDGTVFVTNVVHYNISGHAPSNPSFDWVWYDTSDNLMKKYNTSLSDWETVQMIAVTEFAVSSGSVTVVDTQRVVDFYKRSDKREIMKYSNLSSYSESLAIGASGTQYIAPADGILYWFGYSSSSTSWFVFTNISSDFQTKSTGITSNNTMNCYMPVAKYDTVRIDYSALKSTNVFKFIYTKGELY